MGFIEKLTNRKKEIDSYVDAPISKSTPSKKEEPKYTEVDPVKTKTFSDGSIRKWDDGKQEWIKVE